MYIFIWFFFSVYFVYLISSQGITHMNSSRAVGDILVFLFVNLSDNTAYTENKKWRISRSSRSKRSKRSSRRRSSRSSSSSSSSGSSSSSSGYVILLSHFKIAWTQNCLDLIAKSVLFFFGIIFKRLRCCFFGFDGLIATFDESSNGSFSSFFGPFEIYFSGHLWGFYTLKYDPNFGSWIISIVNSTR